MSNKLYMKAIHKTIKSKFKKLSKKKFAIWQYIFNTKQIKKTKQKSKKKPKYLWARYLLLLLSVIFIASFLYLIRDLPSPKKLTAKENFAVSTQIFDRNGVLLYEIYGDENRIPIKIDTLPPYVIQAAIAIEDKNFYKHFGIDIEGVVRALKKNIINSDSVEGGSTITQQLVKNALLTKEKSIKRKVKEAVLAIITEAIYSKQEILEMYLNYISYGGTSVGIQSASKKYFDKNASELSIAEAALLAGLPQAPSIYSPFGSQPEKAKLRQTEVLRRMREENFITEEELATSENEVLNYALSKTDIKAPHFVFYVRDLLYQKYGEEMVEKGGLRVTTTLDINMQDKAQEIVSSEIEGLKNYRATNGATLITKPNTGEILAMVGSVNYFDTANDGQVNVTIAQRQPGSSIKPLMYATAFQNKTLNPGTVLLDIPTCFNIPAQQDYCPKNYTGDFKGPVTIRQSLGNSLNITAVKSLKTISVQTFMDQATRMGISTWKDAVNYGLSLTLGGGEVMMTDMAQAFGVLANMGVKVPLTPILEIKNYQGEILEANNISEKLQDLEYLTEFDAELSKNNLERVMDKAPAYLTSHILQDNTARVMAFGSNSQLVIKDQVVSVKTGTTNNMKDNWTIGYTPEFLVATWVGNNDNTSMSSIASGVTGAAPIFNDIMTYILQDKESKWQDKPEDIVMGGVCATGMPPKYSDNNCSVRYNELYWENSQPSLSSTKTETIWIDPKTGLPPKEGEQPEGLVAEEKTIYQDPVTENYCSDCNRPVDEEGKIIYEKYIITDEQ